MARPIEYNKAEILEKIMQLFWRKGYESVSVEDIMTETHFNRNSFYTLFTNKDGAYDQALEHYITSGRKEMLRQLGNKKGLAAIKKIFDLNIEKFENTNGCLILNTLNSDSEMSKRAYDRAKKQADDFEAFIHAKLIEARDLGEISSRKDIKTLALLLTTTLFGVRFKLKNGYDKKECKKILNELIKEISAS